MNVLVWILLACAVNVHGVCVPGDQICITQVGRASWCRKESGTCHGAPQVKCHCDPTAIDATATAGSPQPQSTPSIMTPTAPTTVRPERTEHRVFLWLEWPDLETVREWKDFFNQVLGFMDSNCGNFVVWRLVVRVMDPQMYASIGRLWGVSRDSVFFTHFLRKLPADMEVFVYPYMLNERAVRWADAMHTRTPLEGVYKYIHAWNELLLRERLPVRLGGLVTDFEESDTFAEDLALIPLYRRTYVQHGQPRLKFGTALGFDQPRLAAEISPHIDHVYLEMYDLYEVESGVSVEQGLGSLVNQPARFLNKLDTHVWAHLLSHYNQEHLYLMWSLQARSRTHCLYKHDGLCGTKDEFGGWSAEKVSEFLTLAEARHAPLRTHRKGFFQFSYTPRSWLEC